MTTIAFRYGIMAADTGQFIGDTFTGTKTKIEIVGRTIVAVTGHRPDADGLVAWLKRNRKGKIDAAGDAEYTALIHSQQLGLEYVCCAKGGFVTVDSMVAEFAAIGSGREVALGAMAAGATAKGSIRAAAMINVWTRLPVEWMDVNERTLHRDH